MDLERARFNMVEQQIRPWDVLDQSILDLMMETPREMFVPEAYKSMAFSDIEIPLGEGEKMFFPKVEGRILQAINVQSTDSVLEIGTGSGFLTALMAKQAREVTSVDIHAQFTQAAHSKLTQQNIHNVEMATGDASQGWNPNHAYDVIVISGSVDSCPESYRQQLNIGGRLFVIEGEAPTMQANLYTKKSEQQFLKENLFETEHERLVNAQIEETFVL